MSLSLLFSPPDRRRYDRDNLIARVKGAIDGLADGLGCDDNLFVAVSSRLASPTEGGNVRVTIRPEALDG
jgi:crossover junction endodeoxyribonuclease RusA